MPVNKDESGIISPQGSRSPSPNSDESFKLHPAFGTGGKVHYPPPFWQQKMSKSHKIMKMLEYNPDLRRALHASPTLAGEFMKHPDVSREVARDKKLATEIIRRPHLLEELANFHHYAHLEKRKDKVREFIKNMEREYVKNHLNDPGRLVVPNPHMKVVRSDVESEDSLAIGRATLPNIPGRYIGEPKAIKYLVPCSRLFLRHDCTVEDGCFSSCKKTSYYNILNSYGRLMYRVFLRHKHVQNKCCRPLELVVKDPDQFTMFIFTQVTGFSLKHKFKLIVQYPRDKIIGYVEQNTGFRPVMSLKNADNECMIHAKCIKRPLLSFFGKYHPEFTFELRAVGAHNVIGKISSEWIDTPPGAFANERIYGVNFPRDLTPQVKVIVMAAWMLVYLKYFDGKLEIQTHHNLTTEEQAMVRLAEETEEEVHHHRSTEPSSDSDGSRDDKAIEKFRTSFQAAAAGQANNNEAPV